MAVENNSCVFIIVIKSWILFTFLVNYCTSTDIFAGLVFGKIYNDDDRILTTLYEQTLPTCQQQCADRTKCKSINYHTVTPNECELSDRVATNADLGNRFGWIYQADPDWDTEIVCGSCNDDQKCEQGTCVYSECVFIEGNANFIRLGNTNAVSAKAVLGCHSNFYPQFPGNLPTWPVVTECQDTGSWTVTGLTCTNYTTICQEYIVRPEVRDWSRFIYEDVSLVDGPCGVEDNKMTASSIHDNNQNYAASRAKFTALDSWVTATTDTDRWIQVQFDSVTEVKGVKTEGRVANTDHQYVTSFNVAYNVDCSATITSFAYDVNGNQIFDGNNDAITIRDNPFSVPINAKCVRINVIDVVSPFAHIALKFDLVGRVKLPVL